MNISNTNQSIFKQDQTDDDVQVPIFKPQEYPDPEIVLKLPKIKKQCAHQTINSSDLKSMLNKKQSKLRKKHLDKFFIRSLNIKENALRKIKNTDFKDDKIYITKQFAVNVASVNEEKQQYEKFKITQEQEKVKDELKDLVAIFKDVYKAEPKLNIREETDCDIQKQVQYLQGLQKQKVALQQRLDISDEALQQIREEQQTDGRSPLQTNRKHYLQRQMSLYTNSGGENAKNNKDKDDEEMDKQALKEQRYLEEQLRLQEKAQQTKFAINEQIKKIYGQEHMSISQIKQNIENITAHKILMKKERLNKKKSKGHKTDIQLVNQWSQPNLDPRTLITDDKGDFQFDFRREREEMEQQMKLQNNSLMMQQSKNIIQSRGSLENSQYSINNNSSIIVNDLQQSQKGSIYLDVKSPKTSIFNQVKLKNSILIQDQDQVLLGSSSQQNNSKIILPLSNSKRISQRSSQINTDSNQLSQRGKNVTIQLGEEDVQDGDNLENDSQQQQLDGNQEGQEQKDTKQEVVKKKKKKKKKYLLKNIPNNSILEKEESINDIIRNLELLKNHYQKDSLRNINNYSFDTISEEYTIQNRYTEDLIGKYLILQEMIQQFNQNKKQQQQIMQQKSQQQQSQIQSQRSYVSNSGIGGEEGDQVVQQSQQSMSYKLHYDPDINYEDDRIYSKEFYKYLRNFKALKIQKYTDKGKELIEKAKKQLDQCQDKTLFFEELLLYTNAKFIKQRKDTRYSIVNMEKFQQSLDKQGQSNNPSFLQQNSEDNSPQYNNQQSQQQDIEQNKRKSSVESQYNTLFEGQKKRKMKKRLNSQPTLKQLEKMQKKQEQIDFQNRNGLKKQMTILEKGLKGENGDIFEQIGKIGKDCDKYHSQVTRISKKAKKAKSTTQIKYKKLDKTIQGLN